MKKEKKKRKLKKRFWVLAGIILIFFMVIGLATGYVFSKLNKFSYHDGSLEAEVPSGVISGDDLLDDASEENAPDSLISNEEAAELGEAETILAEGEVVSDKDVVNILLLGTDERTKAFSTNARADSIMILSLNKRDNTMKLVSLQRGMGVPVLEGQYEGQYDWITHVFRYGGANLMLRTVREMFHIEVDYYMRVNFNTFAQVVDSVGGVDIELTDVEASALNGEIRTNAYAKHLMYPGVNHLDGYDALQYSRLRYTDSDWKRVQRQRNVIEAVMTSCKDMNLFELDAMLNEVLPLIQTNMSSTEMLSLLQYSPAVLGKNFEQMTIPAKGTYGTMKGMGGRNLYAVDFQQNTEILHKFLYGETATDKKEDADAAEGNRNR